MITERDLQEAIAECQGVRNPNANTCIKLAAYLTILANMKDEKSMEPVFENPGYSFSPPMMTVPYSGDSEFGKRVEGKTLDDVWPEILDLVEAVQVVNPRLYNSFIARL